MKWLAARIFDLPGYSLIVIGSFMLLTVILELTGGDLFFSGLFYNETQDKWPYLARPECLLFDKVSTVPGLTMGISSIVVGVIYAVSQKSWRPIRNGLFLVLALAVGPGLLVNGCKGFCGRPRPHDLVHYGGTHQYLAFWTWGTDRLNCRSFPSGHASMGFYFLTPMFLLRRRRPKLAASVFFFGLIAGCIVGSSRVIQGSHFLSDILWSACLVYITAAILDRIMLAEHKPVLWAMPELTPIHSVSKAA